MAKPTTMSTSQVLAFVNKGGTPKPPPDLDPEKISKLEEYLAGADAALTLKASIYDPFQVIVLAMLLHGSCCKRCKSFSSDQCGFMGHSDPLRAAQSRNHWLGFASQRLTEAAGQGMALYNVLGMVNHKGEFSNKAWLFTPEETAAYQAKHAQKHAHSANQKKELDDFLAGLSAEEATATTQQFAGGTPAQVNAEIKKEPKFIDMTDPAVK